MSTCNDLRCQNYSSHNTRRRHHQCSTMRSNQDSANNWLTTNTLLHYHRQFLRSCTRAPEFESGSEDDMNFACNELSSSGALTRDCRMMRQAMQRGRRYYPFSDGWIEHLMCWRCAKATHQRPCCTSEKTGTVEVHKVGSQEYRTLLADAWRKHGSVLSGQISLVLKRDLVVLFAHASGYATLLQALQTAQ